MNQYFSHDYKARSDKKLVSLAMKHGMAGIGLYWCIIEMLYEEDGYVLRSEYERIAFELRDHSDGIRSVVEDFDLFDFDDDKFWSNSVLKRIKVRDEKSEKARKSVEKRWNNTKEIRTYNYSNTIKEKKRKVKEKKTIIPEHLVTIWPKYVEMRNKIKKPMTGEAINLAIKKLNTLSQDKDVQIKIVERSIFNSWQGLFPIDNTGQTKTSCAISEPVNYNIPRMPNELSTVRTQIIKRWPALKDNDNFPDSNDDKIWRWIWRKVFLGEFTPDVAKNIEETLKNNG